MNGDLPDMTSYYDPPDYLYDDERGDGPLDDGDRAYDEWRDRQMEKEDVGLDLDEPWRLNDDP